MPATLKGQNAKRNWIALNLRSTMRAYFKGAHPGAIADLVNCAYELTKTS